MESRICFFSFQFSKSRWFFLFFNFDLVTQKWKNKSLAIELVTWSDNFYFPTSG